MRRFLALALAVILGAPAVSGADSIDDAFKQMETTIDQTMAAVDQDWERLVAAEEARWEALRAEVEAKWDTFVGSSIEEYVDYSADREARSRIDYKGGQVVVEVLIPAEAVSVPAPAPVPSPEPQAPEQAPQPVPEPAAAPAAVPVQLPEEVLVQIEAQVEKIAKPAPDSAIAPVQDQVKTASGETLTAANAKQFVRQEVAKKVVVEPKVIQGKDGVARRKARVTIPMVPQHLYIRAAKYKDLVLEEAAKVGLEPQLVFAVIQTESYFNPKARSPAYAFGLMQLIPKYGALEALEHLEGERRIVDPEYLYVPENNVRLGVTYLHLLHDRYYGKVQDTEKREVLSVASYNWGPTAVRRKIVEKVDVTGMTAEQLRAEVERRAPEETRNYVVKVTERKPVYDGLVEL